VGYERMEIPWIRILGMGLVVGGLVLVARPWASSN
jgi:hypothetical protein